MPDGGTGWAAELAFAHQLADLADDLTLRAFDEAQDVTTKADGTFVTATDLAVERTLRDAINQQYPEHAVLGEEDGLAGADDAPRWILDPIDATNNFVASIPVFGTLIALAVDDDEVIGVASAPALGKRWDGVVGGAARCNGQAIEVSQCTDLAEAQVSFGGLSYFAARGLESAVTKLTAATRRQRGYGDFWQHCLVAQGSIDIAVEADVSRWDLAAVRVIVDAAGGRFTSLIGEETASGGDAIATNGHLHDQALALVIAEGSMSTA